MRQVQFGCVHYGFARLIAAGYADGLRVVVGLLASGASGFAGLRSPAVLRLRQFVAGVINYVLLRMTWGQGQFETDKALGKHDQCDEQKTFKQPGDEHAAIGEHADGRFSGQALGRTSESRTKGGLEFFPARGPFHEQARRLGPVIFRPTIGDFGYGGNISHSWDQISDYVSGGLILVCQKEGLIFA
jgi:hypothetical protein